MPALKEKYLASAKVAGSIEHPQWGKVYLRYLTLSDIKRIDQANEQGEDHSLAVGLMLGVCDEHGEMVFTADDMNKLLDLPWEFVRPISHELQKQIHVSLEDTKKN